MGAIANCYKEKGDTFETEGGREGVREREPLGTEITISNPKSNWRKLSRY